MVQDGTLSNVNRWKVDFLLSFFFFFSELLLLLKFLPLKLGHDHFGYESLTSYRTLLQSALTSGN